MLLKYQIDHGLTHKELVLLMGIDRSTLALYKESRCGIFSELGKRVSSLISELKKSLLSVKDSMVE